MTVPSSRVVADLLCNHSHSPQYLSKPALFQPSHLHTDVRLALGWTSSLLALSGALYAYKLDDFRASRNYVLASVVGYIILSALMALYSRYVEQDTIFKGKRKVFAGRVSCMGLRGGRHLRGRRNKGTPPNLKRRRVVYNRQVSRYNRLMRECLGLAIVRTLHLLSSPLLSSPFPLSTLRLRRNSSTSEPPAPLPTNRSTR